MAYRKLAEGSRIRDFVTTVTATDLNTWQDQEIAMLESRSMSLMGSGNPYSYGTSSWVWVTGKWAVTAGANDSLVFFPSLRENERIVSCEFEVAGDSGTVGGLVRLEYGQRGAAPSFVDITNGVANPFDTVDTTYVNRNTYAKDINLTVQSDYNYRAFVRSSNDGNTCVVWDVRLYTKFEKGSS
jgi:hypothetical protein